MMSLNGHNVWKFSILFSLLWGFLLVGSLPMAQAVDEIYAVQSRASTPNFQLFLNLADDSTVAASGSLFGPAGGVYGLTYLDGTIYAAELENGTSAEFLATIPHTGALVGQGSRVSANSIGFANVESLAAADGILYGTSFDFSAPHLTTLITIDPVTGIGSAIGVGDPDVFIRGLAFDPIAEILYGAGIPWGDPVTGVLTPNLYTLDRSTGDTTLVGDMGVELQSLAWDSDLGLIGAFDHLYDIDTGTGAASQIGSTDFTDGIPSAFNGLYSLAAVVTTTSPNGDFDGDGDVDGADFLFWQQNGLSSTDLNDWETNYGAGSPLSDAYAAVPEPSALILLLGGIAILLFRSNFLPKNVASTRMSC